MFLTHLPNSFSLLEILQFFYKKTQNQQKPQRCHFKDHRTLVESVLTHHEFQPTLKEPLPFMNGPKIGGKNWITNKIGQICLICLLARHQVTLLVVLLLFHKIATVQRARKALNQL